MKPRAEPVISQVVQRLLEGNMQSYHFRILKATALIIVLILSVTASLEYMGLATPAISYWTISLAFLETLPIIGLAWLMMRRFGDRPWAKWLTMMAIYLCLVIMRTVPYDAPETHAVSYLAIVMSMFYFEPLMIFAFALLCIGSDLLLIRLYPGLLPTEHVTTELLIRYLSYMWAAIAGAIGTRATRHLLEAATELRSSNIRLMEDIDRKEKIDRLRKEFVASASHELKTPISIIEGYANLLKDPIAEEDREKALDIIIDESHRMSLLVGDLLDLSQMESGTLRFRSAEFYIVDLIQAETDRIMPYLKEKDLRLQLDAPDLDILVNADIHRLETVVRNFLQNARQYTAEGGLIQVRVVAEAGAVRIEVENEGRSISNGDLQRIWEPFYRTDKSRNRRTGGTGLGLAISRRILEKQALEFGARNTADGVCFYFTLKTG